MDGIHEQPRLRLVVTDPRMYRDLSKPRRLTDTDFRLAAEAAAALRDAIVERGWPMPPKLFEAKPARVGYPDGSGYTWPVLYLRASDGSGEWEERGFALRYHRFEDVSGEPFESIFAEHGLTCPDEGPSTTPTSDA